MNPAEFRADNPYGSFGDLAIAAPADARQTFIRKTYTHLAAAVYAFVAIEFLLFSLHLDQTILEALGRSRYSWLIVMGAFVGVSWIANSWALSATSLGKQYAGLFLYVVAEAVVFLPLLAIAKTMTMNVPGWGDFQIIPAAGITTLIIFGGLTAFVFISKRDFSFMGGFLGICSFGALALIVVSIIFGFDLGAWFSVLMIVMASGYILYQTSAIMHQYRTDQYVAAALALFASVALLFWYILRIFMSLSDRR
jgi:FtsH-binding integral membrane protein